MLIEMFQQLLQDFLCGKIKCKESKSSEDIEKSSYLLQLIESLNKISFLLLKMLTPFGKTKYYQP